MQSRLIAIVASSTLALAALLGMSEAICMLRECLRDDASLRAVAMLGLPLLVAYLLLSWLLVFPAMLMLHKRLGRVLAPAVVALLFAGGFAVLFHSPPVDGSFVNTLGHVVPWLATAWFLGGVLALTLWPNPDCSVTARTVNSGAGGKK